MVKKIDKVKLVKAQAGFDVSQLAEPVVGMFTNQLAQQTNEEETNKKGANIGGSIGGILDMVAMGFGIPTFGLGKTLGSSIGGSIKGKDEPYRKPKPLTTTQAGNIYGSQNYVSSYQKGGDIIDKSFKDEPTYEAETDEVVIKKQDGTDFIQFFSNKNSYLDHESSVAGLIKGDTHEQDSDKDGQYGEAMSGGDYILSDKKTIDYTNPSKRNGKSVADLAKPVVSRISEIELGNSRFEKNSLESLKQRLEDIKNTFDTNKKNYEFIESFVNEIGGTKKEIDAFQKAIKENKLTIDDFKEAVQELNLSKADLSNRYNLNNPSGYLNNQF